jgi:CubicO group peptidase (beta-lactamase class C family)
MKHVIAMAVCSLLAVSGGSQAAEIALTEKAPSRSEFHGFDPFVKALMAEWKVPGLAIAVIKDGNVLLMKGYGYRDVQRRLPVTPRTLMPIGSNTKSFTATLLGMLVDEKRLEWDRPVREYLADFRLADEVAERLTTARDLLSHRTVCPATTPCTTGEATPARNCTAASGFWSSTGRSGSGGSTTTLWS